MSKVTQKEFNAGMAEIVKSDCFKGFRFEAANDNQKEWLGSVKEATRTEHKDGSVTIAFEYK